jgi:hypothetical protein
MGNMLIETVNRFKPEQIDKLDNLISTGKSFAAYDIEHGKETRASREEKVDTKSGNQGS